MNKAEFLRKLELELSKLPKQEVEEAIRYYTEYIEDAGPENEEQTIGDLGSPAKIATQIKADYAVRHLDGANRGGERKGRIPAILWIITGIFAAPIALPLAIAAGVVAIAMMFALGAIALALLICVVAVFGAGILCVVAGFARLVVDFTGAIFAIGVGLAITGAMLLAGAGIILATRAICRAVARKTYERRMQKETMNGGR